VLNRRVDSPLGISYVAIWGFACSQAKFSIALRFRQSPKCHMSHRPQVYTPDFHPAMLIDFAVSGSAIGIKARRPVIRRCSEDVMGLLICCWYQPRSRLHFATDDPSRRVVGLESRHNTAALIDEMDRDEKVKELGMDVGRLGGVFGCRETC